MPLKQLLLKCFALFFLLQFAPYSQARQDYWHGILRKMRYKPEGSKKLISFVPKDQLVGSMDKISCPI